MLLLRNADVYAPESLGRRHLLLGGGKVQTLSLLIYQQFNLTQDVGFAATMGNVLLIAAMAWASGELKTSLAVAGRAPSGQTTTSGRAAPFCAVRAT